MRPCLFALSHALWALTAAAALAQSPTPLVFDRLDRNGDGSISRVEWAASYAVEAPEVQGVEVVGPDGTVSVLVPRPVERGDALNWQDPSVRAQAATRDALSLQARRESIASAAEAAANPQAPRMGFDAYDVDGNGRISRTEWQAFQGPRPADP